MKRLAALAASTVLLAASLTAQAEGLWYPLFSGENLAGWKASENSDSIWVEDGAIVIKGERSHLFYVGPIEDAEFKNFEFKCKVKTFPNANSGIYFHTEYQEEGWPSKGFECQINNSMKPEPRMTGSLYQVKDILNDSPAEDHEWFDYYIKVDGDTVTIKIDGETVMEWTQPEGFGGPDGNGGRVLSSGTFAFQAHDPGSHVLIKDVRVKPLP